MHIRTAVQFAAEEEKNAIVADPSGHAADLSGSRFHARVLDHSPRFEAREHNIPKCNSLADSGASEDLRLRVVDQLESHAPHILRHSALCVSLVAEKEKLQQQDRCMEHRCSYIRVAVRPGAFRDSHLEGLC
jgi:hypothetical protein